MPSHSERIDFAPPAPPGMLRAMGLAILAHLLLVAALTWGVNWKRKSPPLAAEAELWASVPSQAAPPAPNAPPPRPEPTTAPAPPPKPVEAPPVVKDPDIAAERDKKPTPKASATPKATEPPKPTNKPTEKPTPLAKAEPPKPAVSTPAERKAAKEAQQRDTAAQDQQREKDRQNAIQRSLAQAGGAGAAESTGTAAKSSGPSSGYGARIKSKVKPNLVFTDTPSGNPRVEIEVRLAPDGSILGKPRVTKSSGNREWDDAVVRAFEKTDVLPRDIDGNIHSPLPIGWSVNE
jgi:colicin import membrane protein